MKMDRKRWAALGLTIAILILAGVFLYPKVAKRGEPAASMPAPDTAAVVPPVKPADSTTIRRLPPIIPDTTPEPKMGIRSDTSSS